MAVTQAPKIKVLAIEFETDIDKAGDPVYGKKSFSGIKLTATDQDVFDIAESIKKVLEPSTRNTIINEVDTLVNA